MQRFRTHKNLIWSTAVQLGPTTPVYGLSYSDPSSQRLADLRSLASIALLVRVQSGFPSESQILS